MPNVLTLSCGLTYNGNDAIVQDFVPGINIPVGGDGLISLSHTLVPTFPGTPVPLGSVSLAGGWFFLQNLAAPGGTPGNYVAIMTTVGGAQFARVNPGEFCLFRFSTQITAPYLIAPYGPAYVNFCMFDA